MIVCKSRQHVELERRTLYLRRPLLLALAFSRRTSWLLPRFIHMLPVTAICGLMSWHARDL